MLRRDRNLSRTVTVIAASAAVLVAVLLPLVYFLEGQSALRQEISLKASVKADLISQLAAVSPDIWRYQDTRLVELLTRPPAAIGSDYARVLDANGRQLVGAGKPVAGPALRSSAQVFDAGRAAGQVEVIRSTRHLLESTGALALLGIVIGTVVFVTLRLLPLRALRAATDSLAAHLRYEEKIAGLGQFALGKREPLELIEEALRRVREGLASDAAAYVEPGPGERQLVLRAFKGPRQEQRAATAAYAPDAAIAQVLASGSAARAVARSPAEAVLPFDWAGSFPGALLAPVVDEQRVRGVLCALSASPDPLGTEEIRFLEAAASVLSAGLRRIESEAQLAFLAQFDALTGLPNRSLVSDRLAQTLTLAKRNRWVVGVLFVDLDRFKAVNDTYGHGMGDKLLKLVAQRLQECVRSGDTVGRLSGDEFAIVMSNLAKDDDASIVAQKAISALARPFDLDGHQTFMTASLGIALYPSDGEDPAVLLKNADTAMFRAKEQGRNTYQFYLSQMNERAAARLRTETELRGALERGEFVLHYQPKADLASGEISGFEALLRWQHPQRGLVPPLEFVSILEDTGLIVAVGEWVVREACAQIRRWQADGMVPRPIAVNLSARQFHEKNLDSVIAGILAEYGIGPALLEFELTESMLMKNAEEAARTLNRISACGVGLAIDDFGTGYSSLAYLRHFPLDVLKIDRAFIRDAATNPDDAAIILAMISLAHGMKLEVVAEGVETEAQLNFLRVHGCNGMQGYYFARPLPAAECTRALIEDRRLKIPVFDAAPGAAAILLVDDSHQDLELLKHALAPDGYRIVTVSTPEAGFEALAQSAFHVVISDYQMPGMNGVDFLSSVRRLYPEAVRIMVSGTGEMATVVSAVNEAGVHQYLSKDAGAARLRTAVREAYRRHRKDIKVEV